MEMDLSLHDLRSLMHHRIYKWLVEKLPYITSEQKQRLPAIAKKLEASILKESVSKEDYIDKCQIKNVELRIKQDHLHRHQLHQQQQRQLQYYQQTMAPIPGICHNLTGNMLSAAMGSNQGIRSTYGSAASLSQQDGSQLVHGTFTKQVEMTMSCSGNFNNTADASYMTLVGSSNKISATAASLRSKPRPYMLTHNHQAGIQHFQRAIQQTVQRPTAKSEALIHPENVKFQSYAQMSSDLNSQFGGNQLDQQSSQKQQNQQQQQQMMAKGGNNKLVYGNSEKSLQQVCSSQLISKRTLQLDSMVQQHHSQGRRARKMLQMQTNNKLACKSKSSTNLMTPVKLILFLEHARSCTAQVNCCTTKHCATARNVLKHIDNCCLNQCNFPHCLEARKCLLHFRNCQDPNCPVCVSVRSITAQKTVDDKAETEPVLSSCLKPSIPFPESSRPGTLYSESGVKQLVSSGALCKQIDVDPILSNAQCQPHPLHQSVQKNAAQEVLYPRLKRVAKADIVVNPVDNMPDCIDLSIVGEQPPLKRQRVDRDATGQIHEKPTLMEVSQIQQQPQSSPLQPRMNALIMNLEASPKPVTKENTSLSALQDKFPSECCVNNTNARPGTNAKVNGISQDIEIASDVHDAPVQIDYANEVNINVTVSAQTDRTGPSEDVDGITLKGSTTTENLYEVRSDENACKTILENKDKTAIEAEKPKLKGICMMDYFTPEQVREHIVSLRQEVTKSDELINENCCELCRAGNLDFRLKTIYCTSCGSCVKHDAEYYYLRSGSQKHAICLHCFDNKMPTILIENLMVPKAKFQRKTNLEEDIEEGWVMCDKCQKWQHQICALFNKHRNFSDPTEYTCPDCYIKEVERGDRVPLPQSALPGAKDLPRTRLSDFLEERLFRRLEVERRERAHSVGKRLEDVPGAEGLVLRVVSSVDKRMEVKPRFYETFKEENFPSEFPYTSKLILLFQNIDGAEVCIFALFVQEFGADCPLPNQQSVYLSYLDSVKYFRPDIKTISGEALRTFVFHEILIGYLENCKKRGFHNCYIWACPPEKGNDYIFYCHPSSQIIPKPDKLQEWYFSMLRKGIQENVVVNFTSLYDHFFKQHTKSKAMVTAMRIPYFDGDFWPEAAEQEIYKMNQREMDLKQKNDKTRKNTSSRSRNDLCDNASKDAMLMQMVGERIGSKKKGFIVVHLQYVCSHCGVVMLSGRRWSCNICKHFDLCDSCHSAELQCKVRERHRANCNVKHTFVQTKIDDIMADTSDEDSILENESFTSRQAFLSLCHGNLYQYDTLRRAKHSSMMILYHLHNSSAPPFLPTCSDCAVNIETGQGWRCNICPDFELCKSCYQQSGRVKHPHELTNCTGSANKDVGH